RPQLLDRFGLAVDVRATRDPVQRADVVRRRLAYDADPAGFAAGYAAAESTLAGRIAAARSRLPRVVLTDAALRQVTAVCAAFDVDGLRADLVTARAAVALAAWAGRDEVIAEDVRVAARLALPHRRRRDPFDAPGLDEQRLEQAISDALPDPPAGGPDGPEPDGPEPDGPEPDGGPDGPEPEPDGPEPDGPEPDGSGGEPANPPAPGSGPAGSPDGGPDAGTDPALPGTAQQPVAAADPPYRTRLLSLPSAGVDGPAGRRARTTGSTGRTVGSRLPAGRLERLHLAATLAAAAPHQRGRGRSGPGLLLTGADLRSAVREGRESTLVLFCVDASGSMAARQRMRAVKAAVLSLLLDAYQRRDKVGLVTFRGAEAVVALPPTSSVDLAAARLRALPTGGRTPLAAGLDRSARLLRSERLRDPRRRPLLVVVTDGRHTSGGDPVIPAAVLAASGVDSVVVDCEAGPVRLGLAARLAGALDAAVLGLAELAAFGAPAGRPADGPPGRTAAGPAGGGAAARAGAATPGPVVPAAGRPRAGAGAGGPAVSAGAAPDGGLAALVRAVRKAG
ncbi:MAG: magnesium chelatase subunit, partial [Mycobacteriales bacterium]